MLVGKMGSNSFHAFHMHNTEQECLFTLGLHPDGSQFTLITRSCVSRNV